MKQPVRSHQHGFTLVELLIATTVFSVILLAAAAALIQVGRLYYKGIIVSKTQGVARTVIDDVSRSLQFSSGNLSSIDPDGIPGDNPVTSTPITRAYCIGNTRYTYLLGFQVNGGLASGEVNEDERQARHVLWQDRLNSETCETDLPNLTLEDPYNYSGVSNNQRNGRELLEDNMRLQEFGIGGNEGLFNVDVKVIYYAGSDLLDNFDNPTTCQGSLVGGQWCAISDLSSVVYSRSR